MVCQLCGLEDASDLFCKNDGYAEYFEAHLSCVNQKNYIYEKEGKSRRIVPFKLSDIGTKYRFCSFGNSHLSTAGVCGKRAIAEVVYQDRQTGLYMRRPRCDNHKNAEGKKAEVLLI